MKKIQSILLVLICATAFSQQRGMQKIEWIEKKAISFGSYSIIAPSFKSKSFQLDGEKKEVLFTLNLPLSYIVQEESIQITDLIFETITPDQLGDLAIGRIPNQINPKLINNIARNNNAAFISLSPIIKEGNTFKRLVSFTYSFVKSPNQVALSGRAVSEIQNSILSTGDWYRFYVEKSGVYKISKNFLNQLGLNTASDPRKIKIFGNGGRMLPLANQTFYPNDLIENAIQIVGENDGVFDSDDYVLFYAEGIDSWSDENQTHLNLYDTKSYYYVTTNGANGKRTSEMIQPVDANPIPITSFTDYQFHEKDLTNVVRTGRRWTGEAFNIDNEQTFDFTFPNIITTSPLELFVSAASAAFTPTAFEIQVNNQLAGSMNFSALSTSSGTELTFNSLNQNSILPSSPNVSVKLKYNNNGVPSSKAYLDYIVIKAKRSLSGYGKQFRFQYDAASTTAGVGEFQFTNASGIKQIWDITDPYNCSYSSNENQSNFAFKATLGESRKYIALDPTDFYYPLKEAQTKVTNQNIKGTIFKNDLGQFQDIDYLIITPLFLNSQAEKLANFHRNYSQLNVKVVNLESIYPEFSSGKQDVAAIRNLVKYVYKNASTPEKRVRYVNLFGDASFDFKDRIPNNTNIVPIFHSINSTSAGESSFASDDFFGLMDDSEGNVISYFGGIDIAVGRMLVNTPEQAEQMITKVLEYHDIKSYGNWRNNCVFISDDSDKASDASLQFRQNQLSDVLFAEKPFLNIKKILLDSYVQETSSGGNRYPKAREDLFNAFEKGALVFNYLGHGGEDGLSGERIWEKIDGQNLINQYKYPLFITITCDFSRFDNPYRPTAGEYTYWNPKGGAISMITTIRSIGQYSAEFFNDQLSSHLFSYGSNEYPSMAEALRLAKNSNPNSSSNVVFYIGDPAIMLAIAKPKIRLTKINDAPITGPIDDLQSLAYVKISGEVTDENNTPLTGYSGALSVTVFDKFVNKTTINNDGNSPPIPFNALGETIFRGNASVTNGAFEFGFMVPRDIRIPVGNGRISFYSKRNQLLLDKSGYDSTIKIGGINPNATADNVGPKAQLYMNDQSFIYGGITNESPLLLAFLEDENGINTASGIGHDIVAILDGDESNPYVLNDYYETELDNYKKGKLQFPFRNLSVGLHSITLKAWDVYNNPITAEIQFIVVGDETITLTNVLNYPNPFVNYTQFWFTHNRPFEPLEVQVQVLTITGKIVWTKNQTVTTDGFLSREITWDGKDDFGDKIGKGVYIYKLTVKSLLTNTKSEKYEKLVIL
jgi:hypothetical protein